MLLATTAGVSLAETPHLGKPLDEAAIANLAENKLIDAKDTINAETLPKVKMPNRDNFIIRFPDRI